MMDPKTIFVLMTITYSGVVIRTKIVFGSVITLVLTSGGAGLVFWIGSMIVS